MYCVSCWLNYFREVGKVLCTSDLRFGFKGWPEGYVVNQVVQIKWLLHIMKDTTIYSSGQPLKLGYLLLKVHMFLKKLLLVITSINQIFCTISYCRLPNVILWHLTEILQVCQSFTTIWSTILPIEEVVWVMDVQTSTYIRPAVTSAIMSNSSHISSHIRPTVISDQ